MPLELFFHTVVSKDGFHEVTAFKDGNDLMVIDICPITGRKHIRFFETLREFALWHYHDQNHTILDREYPFEREVKVLYQPLTEQEINETLGIVPQPPKLKPNLPPTSWDTPRATLNTILWTV